ncbi:MAG: calcium/sodium antiporter [Lachnospiraceae bacterium]|nr:calcium/sodium antiporter [Lachnospiraceae bacterium]
MLEVVGYIVLLLVGFFGLIKGADLFVDGSSSLAKIFKVPGVIIGLTIVAMGTSAPELAVSTSAALSGSNEIALSNVIGSNIFNLLMVLGICSIICKVPVDKVILKRDFPVMLLVTLGIILGTGLDAVMTGSFLSGSVLTEVGMVNRWLGLALVAVFVVYLVVLIADAKKHPVEEEDEIKAMPAWKCFLCILVGLILIVAGGKATVESAKYIAKAVGMSETIIGLTVVAAGTSLPELVTSIVAAKKGEVGMAVGNAVGSCIFNAMLILGVSSFIHPFPVNAASVFDMIILLGISVVTFIFAVTGKAIKRWQGIAMVLMYAADVAFAVLREVR